MCDHFWFDYIDQRNTGLICTILGNNKDNPRIKLISEEFDRSHRFNCHKIRMLGNVKDLAVGISINFVQADLNPVMMVVCFGSEDETAIGSNRKII